MDPDVLINPPRQERSRDSLRRIVTAGRELLRERDFDAVTVDEIVARAGSSKGSFYHRFADKDSLLLYLLREEHAEALEAWSKLLDPDRWRHRPLGEVLDAFLDRLLEIYRGRPSLMRAYAGKIFAGEGEIRALSVQLNRHVLALLRGCVDQKSREIRHPDPARATAFLLTTLIALLPPLFLYSTPELMPEPLDPETLEREVRRLIRSYVGLDEPDRGPKPTKKTKK
ncbi:MAG: TetR/AcrR family transcriptional regulator [Gemmatimonadota bacterium]|nr:TetR/AcrR family transcriptional regulator [Gemmatimonadota bacterium]